MIKKKNFFFLLNILLNKPNIKLIYNENFIVLENLVNIKVLLKKKLIFFALNFKKISFFKILFFFFFIFKKKIQFKNFFLVYEFNNHIQINEFFIKKNILGFNKFKLFLYFFKYFKKIQYILFKVI